MKRKLQRLMLGLLVLAGIIAAALCLWPVGDSPALASNPASRYAEAIQRARALDTSTAGPLAAEGRTIVLTHGRPAGHVAVLFHGYTSCPAQFREFGKRLYARGWNVLIPRMPHHGLANRLTGDQSNLTAEEVMRWTNESVDIAHGLGNSVTTAGLSAGGLAAAWVAENRGDVGRVIVIAPAFGYKAVPTRLTRPAMNLYRLLPDSYSWWDDKAKDTLRPLHCYPRYSTRALANLLRLSFILQRQAATQAPAAPVTVVTNLADDSVNNALTAQVVSAWRSHPGAQVKTYQFPASFALEHDMIDPENPHQHVDRVYPTLLGLMQ